MMPHSSITSLFTDTAGLVTVQNSSYTSKETSARSERGGDKITKMMIFSSFFPKELMVTVKKGLKTSCGLE